MVQLKMDGNIEDVPQSQWIEVLEGKLKVQSERVESLEKQLKKERELREETEQYNKELKLKVDDLQNDINCKTKTDYQDSATQTDEVQISRDNGECSIDDIVQEKVTEEAPSIADSIRDAAHAAMATSGFVYDVNSGLYYDYSSGYYYNPENHLYYDTTTGIYYYFDENTDSYQFHSQVEIQESTTNQPNMEQQTDGAMKKSKKHNKAKERKSRKHEERKKKKREKRYLTDEDMDKQSKDRIHDRRRRNRHKDNKVKKKMKEVIRDNAEKTKIHRKKKKKKDKEQIKDILKVDKETLKDTDMIEVINSEGIQDHKDRDSHVCIKNNTAPRNNSPPMMNASEINVIVISSESEIEEGEIASSPSSRCSLSRCSSLDVVSSDSADDSSAERMEEENVQVNRREYPPCIRMIVTKSDSIQLGSLYIITCMGGSIGREGPEHAVVVPESGISKRHAEIFYAQDTWQYFIKDLGSQNGTQLNSKSLSQPRTESEPHSLSHKDYLTVGLTTFRLHIHPGAETCDECEPGQVQALIAQTQIKAPVVIPVDKEQQRRKGLKEIKKKYGLSKDVYITKNPSTANTLYSDRAEVRRQTVGSDNPHQQDDLPASVDREIAEDNLGRKMMEKMGWKHGDTLGKDNTGIKEPITVLLNNKRAGLGGKAQKSISEHAQGRSASEKWDKARARFDAIDKGGKKSTQPEKIQMAWASGGVVKTPFKKENIFGNEELEEEAAEEGAC